MAKNENIAPATKGWFKTPEQFEAARADMAKVKTADDVRAVWNKHLMQVGHKVLGRLLIGLSPIKNE